VKMDPRVKASTADLQTQFNVSKSMYDSLLKATEALHEITVLRQQMKARSADAAVGSAQALNAKLDAIAGREGRGGGRGGPVGPPTLTSVRAQIARLEHEIENTDEAPTTAQVTAATTVSQPLEDLLQQWNRVKATDLKALNHELQSQHLATLKLDVFHIDHDVEDQFEAGDEP
jgi:hypothetical protein